MYILVLGGTQFVGRAIVEQLVPNNHVTLFNRGSDIEEVENGNRNHAIFPNLSRIFGDRNNIEDIKQLRNYKWDLVIDLEFSSTNVINMVDNLLDIVPIYTFISTGALNDAVHCEDKQDSQDTVWPDGTTYETACKYIDEKKKSEEYIMKTYQKWLIFRPYYLCGEFDYSNRFDYTNFPELYFKETNTKVENYEIVNNFAARVRLNIERGEFGFK